MAERGDGVATPNQKQGQKQQNPQQNQRINGVKVQRFCLTLLGEARLWFQSLEPLNNVTWSQLQIYLGKDIQR